MRSSRVFDAKDKKRLVVVACFLFFLFCLIVVQFFYLQITQGNKWEKIASNQHQLEITQYFMRGGFYSNTEIKKEHPNEKIPFVVEVPKFHMYIDPCAI